eukprot:8665417-Lingulodinium_polyedra.AAC.1
MGRRTGRVVWTRLQGQCQGIRRCVRFRKLGRRSGGAGTGGRRARDSGGHEGIRQGQRGSGKGMPR